MPYCPSSDQVDFRESPTVGLFGGGGVMAKYCYELTSKTGHKGALLPKGFNSNLFGFFICTYFIFFILFLKLIFLFLRFPSLKFSFSILAFKQGFAADFTVLDTPGMESTREDLIARAGMRPYLSIMRQCSPANAVLTHRAGGGGGWW